MALSEGLMILRVATCLENAVGAALVAAQGAHEGRPYKAFRAFSWFPGSHQPRAATRAAPTAFSKQSVMPVR